MTTPTNCEKCKQRSLDAKCKCEFCAHNERALRKLSKMTTPTNIPVDPKSPREKGHSGDPDECPKCSNWVSDFCQEFGTHFSKSELQFAIAFIDSLISLQRKDAYNEGVWGAVDMLDVTIVGPLMMTDKQREIYKDTILAILKK